MVFNFASNSSLFSSSSTPSSSKIGNAMNFVRMMQCQEEFAKLQECTSANDIVKRDPLEKYEENCGAQLKAIDSCVHATTTEETASQLFELSARLCPAEAVNVIKCVNGGGDARDCNVQFINLFECGSTMIVDTPNVFSSN